MVDFKGLTHAVVGAESLRSVGPARGLEIRVRGAVAILGPVVESSGRFWVGSLEAEPSFPYPHVFALEVFKCLQEAYSHYEG